MVQNYPHLKNYLEHSLDSSIKLTHPGQQKIGETLRKWGIPEFKKRDFPYNLCNRYQTWVNFSPFYFREFFREYTTYRSNHEANSSPLLGNDAFMMRYLFRCLIPGAYLDTEIQTEEKLRFLNEICSLQRATPRRFNLNILLEAKDAKQPQKKALSSFVPTLEEACEYLYFGEQYLGFPSFGLAREEDRWSLYQEFDLNFGSHHLLGKKVLPGTIKVVTTISDRLYRVKVEPSNAHIFMHRTLQDSEFREDRPPLLETEEWLVKLGDASLRTKDLEDIETILHELIADTAKRFSEIQTEEEGNLVYAYLYSLPIINLSRYNGSIWHMPKEAAITISENKQMQEIKKKYKSDFDFEAFFSLLADSRVWIEKCLVV